MVDPLSEWEYEATIVIVWIFNNEPWLPTYGGGCELIVLEKGGSDAIVEGGLKVGRGRWPKNA